MSSSATGAARVASVERQLAALGYRFVRSSASGRAGSAERRENRIPGDLIAFAPADTRLPHLLVECGGIGKRVGSAFAELTERPLPVGFIPLVARCVRRSWRWHIGPDRCEAFASLEEALDAVRDS